MASRTNQRYYIPLQSCSWIHTTTTTRCLVQFRNVVLQQFGIERSNNPKGRRRLTSLVRRDYVTHPRSNGRAEQLLSRMIARTEGLVRGGPWCRKYPRPVSTRYNTCHLCSRVLSKSSGYQRRLRFRFLSECLNLTYDVAKQEAWAVEQFYLTTATKSRCNYKATQGGRSKPNAVEYWLKNGNVIHFGSTGRYPCKEARRSTSSCYTYGLCLIL
jgi:hypothetical protein